MSATPTLEQVEQLARQLPPQDQEALMHRIAEQLQTPPQHKDFDQGVYTARIDAFLAAANALAERVETEFDSVEDLRRSREERMKQL